MVLVVVYIRQKYVTTSREVLRIEEQFHSSLLETVDRKYRGPYKHHFLTKIFGSGAYRGPSSILYCTVKLCKGILRSPVNTSITETITGRPVINSYKLEEVV